MVLFAIIHFTCGTEPNETPDEVHVVRLNITKSESTHMLE